VVEALDGYRRLDELALMFGGANEANRIAAGEALTSALQYKQQATQTPEF
jgi:hypothetical protein